MHILNNFIATVLGFTAGTFGIIFWILFSIGGIYWLWMAIQLGSFFMFFVGLFPITAVFLASPVGAWSLLFGAPDWVLNFFG